MATYVFPVATAILETTTGPVGATVVAPSTLSGDVLGATESEQAAAVARAAQASAKARWDREIRIGWVPGCTASVRRPDERSIP